LAVAFYFCLLKLLFFLDKFSKLLLKKSYLFFCVCIVLFNTLTVVVIVFVQLNKFALLCKKLFVMLKNIFVYMPVHLSKHLDVEQLLYELFLLIFLKPEEVVVLV